MTYSNNRSSKNHWAKTARAKINLHIVDYVYRQFLQWRLDHTGPNGDTLSHDWIKFNLLGVSTVLIRLTQFSLVEANSSALLWAVREKIISSFRQGFFEGHKLAFSKSYWNLVNASFFNFLYNWERNNKPILYQVRAESPRMVWFWLDFIATFIVRQTQVDTKRTSLTLYVLLASVKSNWC